MTNVLWFSSSPAVAANEPSTGTARAIYADLHDRLGHAGGTAASRDFLGEQLSAAAELPCELPSRPTELETWITDGTAAVGRQYRDYLARRRAGAARRYFGCRAHALNFVKGVAPTKLVDGAWLYGLLRHWSDARFRPLIRIYLEELGDGVPGKNHVLLYRKLLATHGCEQLDDLSDAHYLQGAIQLALAAHGDEFLPELIGYNLGYEQLPLHLLISAYELNELGIDPYYFTLHVTVDNAASGHARKALQGLFETLHATGDAAEFYRRVRLGSSLNLLGVGSNDVIAAFDLERELTAMLARKATAGAQLHADYCRVGGRSVSDWLADPERMPEFLAALQDNGWILRHRDPSESRFWRLVEGERAQMFGVFTPYERQLLYDWIAGDAPRPRTPSFRARHAAGASRDRPRRGTPRPLFRRHGGEQPPAPAQAQLRRLERQLADLPSKEQLMPRLIELMAPAAHHTPPGLMATRLFSQLLD